MKKYDDFINFTRAGEIFAFANTPRYIIKHLRREQFVSDLSRKFRGKHLFDEIKRLDEINGTEFNDYLKAYVLIIAISLQCEKDSRKYIEEFSKTSFRWAKEISGILISERMETTIVNFEYKYCVEPKIKISEG
ncbi:hypothetical protein QUF72_10185 [Desulfobacterales bacterium HSG2]|nr:hypothetical protein [Desulfobacterales bacterium HSG2]